MTQRDFSPEPLSRRRAIVSKRDERRQSLRSAAPIVVTSVGIITLLTLLAVVTMPRRYTQGPLYSGMAQVENVVFSSGHRSGYTSGGITFRIGGQHVMTSTRDLTGLTKLARTRVGTTVPVTYHKDKDGTIYVADWQVPRP